MKIGLLSDTHSYLDPKVLEHFVNCDEIWHAGDIGDASVIRELERVKPVRAVYGNIDDKETQARWPEVYRVMIEGISVLMIHIGGTPPRYNARVKSLLKEKTPDLFVCGHSHILKVGRDPDMRNMLFVNPGAAGHHGFHIMRTAMRFEILAGEIKNMEVIELGKRGIAPAITSSLP